MTEIFGSFDKLVSAEAQELDRCQKAQLEFKEKLSQMVSQSEELKKSEINLSRLQSVHEDYFKQQHSKLDENRKASQQRKD